ncbi:MAG: hypothetical protein WCA19_27230 [Candidatus Acidiferrales bacterium]
MIRARTLFPLRNGSVTVAAKPTADARAVLSSEVFLEQLEGRCTPSMVTTTDLASLLGSEEI